MLRLTSPRRLIGVNRGRRVLPCAYQTEALLVEGPPMTADADQKTKQLYEFGPFRVDTEKELLLRGDETVALTPKTFQILLVLIRHSKELVTKDDMMKTVWPDTFVEEANLSRNIFMLRKALGESPQDHQYIVTVPGRGYRFAENVQLVPEQDLSIVAASHATVEVEVTETRDWRLPALAAFLLVVGVAAAAYSFFAHRAPVLSEKDAIVLADFANSTGDPVFDGTLRQGTEVQLEQSPYLTLVSEQRIRQILRLMDQPADARLTSQLAREVCERTGSTAVADGSIQLLGTQYVLSLRARNCRTGNTLDEEQAQAARKEDVLSALGGIASRFRKHIGESKVVEEHNIPLEEATTPSLEALKAYSAARMVNYTDASLSSAIPLLQRAIEIDPNFAMAYAFLGRIYGDIGEDGLSAENARKAYLLKDHANGRERFFIEVTYERQVTGNLERAHQTLLAWARTYPRDRDAHGLLSGFTSQGAGNFQEAIEEGEKAINIEPDWPVAYTNVAFTDLYLNRPDETAKILQRASDRKLVFPDFTLLRYFVGFLSGDSAEMAHQAALGEKQFANQDWMFHVEALTSARSGRLKIANEMSRHAVELAEQVGQHERAAVFASGEAVWQGFLGESAAASSGASHTLEISKGRDSEYGAGVAFALAGNSSHAQSLLDDLQRRFPEDTTVLNSYLPTLHGLLALNRGEPLQAIASLEPAVAYEGAVPGVDAKFFFGGLYSAYVRGNAYLAARRGQEAAVEFQKILDHRGIVGIDPIGALVYLQLGRAYALSGDRTHAASFYKQFLSQWKNADLSIPILKQANTEYLKLQDLSKSQ